MINKEHYQFIRNHPAFEHLSTESFDKLASEIHYRKIPKDQILFFSGDRRDKLFLLYKGYAKIEQYDRTDSFSYVDYIKEENMFPYGGMFHDDYYHYTGLSVTELEFFSIPVDLYEEFSKVNIEQLYFITHKLSTILKFHELRLRNAVLSSATERVIQSLSILCMDLCRERDDLPFLMSMQELAKIGATTRETVSHVLKKLKEEGRIDYSHRKLVFKDKPSFLKYFDENQ